VVRLAVLIVAVSAMFLVAMTVVTLVLLALVTVPMLVVFVPCAGRHHALGQKLHAALRATVRLVTRHLGMHRTDVSRLFSRLA
jgi:hypothetical protein